MGKITNALKKAAEERIQRIEKITKIREHDSIVIKKMGNSNVDARLIAYFDPKSPLTEQYKVLRTNLMSLDKSRGHKVISITSSLHSEGKTITSLNLAFAMAQLDQRLRILLVDADMRRGRLAKYLGIQQEIGLSELLSQKVSLSETLFNIDVPNLTFMAAGGVPEHPVELLSSDYMKDVLSQLRAQFDYVLIDTPPLIPVTDPGIIGAQTDGTLMVIQAGRTQRGIVMRASELLQQARARLLGYVLTNIQYHLPEYIYRYL